MAANFAKLAQPPKRATKHDAPTITPRSYFGQRQLRDDLWYSDVPIRRLADEDPNVSTARISARYELCAYNAIAPPSLAHMSGFCSKGNSRYTVDFIRVSSCSTG